MTKQHTITSSEHQENNMTTNKTITSFNVSWTADHEEYLVLQGRGKALDGYTDRAVGCGETLREAFEDALEDLAQQDINDHWAPEMLAELTSQVKEPAMLDQPLTDNHDNCKGIHCAMCAGKWHYYVSIDVTVE